MLFWMLFFLVTTVICAIGWINSRLARMIVLYYYVEKYNNTPTDEDIQRCGRKVIRHLFHKE